MALIDNFYTLWQESQNKLIDLSHKLAEAQREIGNLTEAADREIAGLHEDIQDLQRELAECKEEYAKLAFETSRQIGNLQRKQAKRGE